MKDNYSLSSVFHQFTLCPFSTIFSFSQTALPRKFTSCYPLDRAGWRWGVAELGLLHASIT